MLHYITPRQTKLLRYENAYHKSLKWGRLSLHTDDGKYFKTQAIFVITYISINFDGNNDTMFIV